MSELPPGWSHCVLGDLAEYVTSGSRDWSRYYATKGAFFVRTQDINKNRLAPLDDIARVALPDSVEGKRTLIIRDDLLITITGANVGKCAHVDRAIPEAYVSQSVALVRLVDRVLTRFVHRQLIAPGPDGERTLLQQSAYGLGRPVLNLDNVRNTQLYLAPLNEQKRIADKLDAVLTRVDACRERLDRVPAILKRFRQAVLAAATSGKLTEEWRVDTEVAYHDVGEEPLAFPNCWEVHKVGDVFSLIDGDRGPNYPKQNDYLPEGHCLFLSTKNVRPFGFLFDEIVFLTEEKHKTLRNGTLQLGDVVITTRGTLGNVAVYDETVPYKIVRINSGMLILRNKDTEVINQFLKFYIASPLFFIQLNKKQSGSAQPQIPAGILKTFVIPLPPIEEQHEIIRRVETLFSYADRLEARYTVARAQVEGLTPALLAKAFRGELVPQDPNDEPASALLERIHTARVASDGTAAPKRRTGSGRPKTSQKTEVVVLTRKDIQDTHLTTLFSASSASSRCSSP